MLALVFRDVRRPQPTHATLATHARGTSSRQLRIVGGRLRGRRWRFPAGDVRPTPDRVRETLFNWLQHDVTGRRSLDLYAGSGALGLEALSRGAAAVVFVEQQPRTASALRALLRDWQLEDARVEQTDVARFLAGPPQPFGLVFLDPPYAAGLLVATAAALSSRGWLADGARIYVERSRREPLPPLPESWHELRAGHAGEVGYHLFEYRGGKGRIDAR